MYDSSTQKKLIHFSTSGLIADHNFTEIHATTSTYM